MNQLVKRGTAILCALTLFSTWASAAETIPSRETVHGSLWNEQGIFVNGVELDVVEDNTQYAKYQILVVNGAVYIPLHTAAELLGAEANWNETTAVLSLTRTKEPYVREKYVDIIRVERTQEEIDAFVQQIQQDLLMGIDVELRPDITLLLDGEKHALTNAQGEAVYPFFNRDVLYLPVRSVGELCGMEVAYLPRENGVFAIDGVTRHSFNELYEPFLPVAHLAQIHLYDTPTQAELESVRDYLDTANKLYLQCVEATAAIPDDLTTFTREQAIAQLEIIASYAGQLRFLPAPDAPFFTWEVGRLGIRAWEVQEYQAGNYMDYLEYKNYTVQQILRRFKDDYMLASLYYLRGQLEEGQQLLDIVQANSSIDP